MYEPKRNTDFVPPINDFTERYDEPTVDAHSNPREVIWGIIASMVAVPVLYIAFCAVLALGDIF
nr:MAG TPA: hypothetical protein [Caudoviricetes sp.]